MALLQSKGHNLPWNMSMSGMPRWQGVVVQVDGCRSVSEPLAPRPLSARCEFNQVR